MAEEKTTKAAKTKKAPSFEEALTRLEDIANTLENESPDLAKALELYEESARLLKGCSEMLDEAQKKIVVLTKGE